MFDWYNLTANALWIFSLSLILTTVSLARWKAQTSGKGLTELLNLPMWQSPLNLAGVMFCGGLAFISDQRWKQVLWSILMGLFLVQIMVTWLLAQDEN